jgi:hypothetical protein
MRAGLEQKNLSVLAAKGHFLKGTASRVLIYLLFFFSPLACSCFPLPRPVYLPRECTSRRIRREAKNGVVVLFPLLQCVSAKLNEFILLITVWITGSSAALGLVKVQSRCEELQNFGSQKQADGKGPLLDETEALDKCGETLSELEKVSQEVRARVLRHTLLRKLSLPIFSISGSILAQGFVRSRFGLFVALFLRCFFPAMARNVITARDVPSGFLHPNHTTQHPPRPDPTHPFISSSIVPLTSSSSFLAAYRAVTCDPQTICTIHPSFLLTHLRIGEPDFIRNLVQTSKPLPPFPPFSYYLLSTLKNLPCFFASPLIISALFSTILSHQNYVLTSTTQSSTRLLLHLFFSI